MPVRDRPVAVTIICLASTVATVEPIRKAALAHAMRVASGDVINTNLAVNGPASIRTVVITDTLCRPVPAREQQYAAAMAPPIWRWAEPEAHLNSVQIHE